MVALKETVPEATGPVRRIKPRSLTINGPAYITVRGRVYKLTPNALRSYFREYELDRGLACGFNDCLEHIAQEMEVALEGKPRAIGIRGRLFQYESQSLLFKLVGSKVMNIRINLKTGERINRG